MDFLTLSELARQFNKPERVIRYKFRTLLTTGRLTEGEDFRKEDFVDELHFAYKINPLRFMEEAKLVLDQGAVTNIVNDTVPTDTNPANHTLDFDSNADNENEAGHDRSEEFGSQPATNEDNPGYQGGNNPSESVSKIDDKAAPAATNQETVADKTVMLDYIDTMKEQLRVKDGQIESYKQQLDDQSGVTRAAITELLKMKDQLLQLRAGAGSKETTEIFPREPEGSQVTNEGEGETGGGEGVEPVR